MANIRRERRLRAAEQALAEQAHLSSPERRVLTGILATEGWHLLTRHRAYRPTHPTAFAIGPTGVFAIVFAATAPDATEFGPLRKHAEEPLARLAADDFRFVPHMVEIVVVLPGRVRAESDGRLHLVDEAGFVETLIRHERRFKPARAAQLAAAGIDDFTRLHLDLPTTDEPTDLAGLFTETDLNDAERTAALARPFSDWMTFLDPAQLSLVHTNFTGPARISGPAGTGKSVVALHRMAHWAKRNPGRLLFTTFVKTLPTYHERGFARLAPRAVDRAEFTGLHAWTVKFLSNREVSSNLDEKAIDAARADAWIGVRDTLERVNDTDFGYWRDEIDRVIKGRGLPNVEAYKRVRRRGRDGTSLNSNRRQFVWERWYEPYQRGLEARGAHDFNDLISLAIAELRARPLTDAERFDLVVVDEVQDFTLCQLQLVYEIAGARANSLILLVGDGQQEVYAGGCTLSEAGIPLVGGRGRVLRTNYRNRAAILDYARRIEASDTVDDLDGGTGVVLRDSDTTLPDGKVVEERLTRHRAESAVPQAIRAANLTDADIAVIVPSHTYINRYLNILRRAGFPAIPLEHYDGTQTTDIKVGTIRRAKGMDFTAVFLLTKHPPTNLTDLSPAARDQAELQARQHLVAASRARDHLWVGLLTD
ncbi:UvrD-helicase domain-containing protein [Nocardia mangyaensis]|uniref:UvrD-helicase domain-containing protein n=1 Tax=Nocardia mangyaensis TaxID=2213200 RepID=UPI002674B13F|nr:UvrD-helicase domain-containing protein [Nocardia mangyaensis]MDO3650914.1 UvrD-helicase domain-containing protein [Nocardia mangyaensis]